MIHLSGLCTVNNGVMSSCTNRPAGIQIAIDRVRHISWHPPEMEPFYQPSLYSLNYINCLFAAVFGNTSCWLPLIWCFSFHLDVILLINICWMCNCVYSLAGQEKMPFAVSHRGHGRVVYEYEPTLGNYVSLSAYELSAWGCLCELYAVCVLFIYMLLFMC